MATIDIQEFTADGTWTKPSGADLVFVYCLGAGGGAKAGNKNAVGVLSSSGPGGGGGGIGWAFIPAEFVSTSVNVYVGVGGTGGTGTTTDTGSGTAGTAGTKSQFGQYLVSGGGGAGINAGATGGAGGGGHCLNGLGGGQGGNNSTGPERGADSNDPQGRGLYCGGGGGGGQITSTNNPQIGAFASNFTGVQGYDRGSLGGVGSSATQATNPMVHVAGCGGGSGLAAGGPGGDGANANGLGGGGGGGGSCRNDGGTVKSGDGGDGGDGIVIVVTYGDVDVGPPLEALSGTATLDFAVAAAATVTAELSGVATLDFTTDGTIAHLPHVAHIIKMADETRGPISPVPITDDAELSAVLRPSTIYMVRIVMYLTSSPSAGVWIPRCSSPVDFCALFNHRNVGDSPGETWASANVSNHYGHLLDTARLNAATSLPFSNGGARHVTGMIKTGPGGGTFSIQWGGGNNARTVEAGSFLYLKEAQAY